MPIYKINFQIYFSLTFLFLLFNCQGLVTDTSNTNKEDSKFKKYKNTEDPSGIQKIYENLQINCTSQKAVISFNILTGYEYVGAPTLYFKGSYKTPICNQSGIKCIEDDSRISIEGLQVTEEHSFDMNISTKSGGQDEEIFTLTCKPSAPNKPENDNHPPIEQLNEESTVENESTNENDTEGEAEIDLPEGSLTAPSIIYINEIPLTLTYDDLVTEMKISETANCSAGNYQAVQLTFSLSLDVTEKSISVKFKTAEGTESICYPIVTELLLDWTKIELEVWPIYKNELDKTKTENQSGTLTIDSFGSLTGTHKWFGGVLATNGKIYGIPFTSTTVLEIDPINNTATTFGSLPSGQKWIGGTLANNGKIYGIPFNTTSVLEIDPVNQTTNTFGNLSGTGKWGGGILAPNGKIYAIPYNSTTVLEIDPVNQTTNTFGNLNGTGKWHAGVLAPNGKIYGIPSLSESVLEIDPDNQTVSTFGSLGTDGGKWFSGVLASNGKIYGIPLSSTAVLEIDPDNQTAVTFGSLSSDTDKWRGGVLAPNGKIYGIPHAASTILEIDPINQSVNTLGNVSTDGSKWYGGVLAPNGKIYAIPRSSESILEIDLGVTHSFDSNIPLSGFFNKL